MRHAETNVGGYCYVHRMENEREIHISVPENASQAEVDAAADKAVDAQIDKDIDDLLKGF